MAHARLVHEQESKEIFGLSLDCLAKAPQSYGYTTIASSRPPTKLSSKECARLLLAKLIRSEAYNFIGKQCDYDYVFLCFRAALIVSNAYAFQLCKRGHNRLECTLATLSRPFSYKSTTLLWRGKQMAFL